MRISPILITAACAALALPAGAAAVDYPPPNDPGKVQSRQGGKKLTLTVCKKKGKCHYRSIQDAVDHARGGDTVRVKAGTYKENVKIAGKGLDGLRLIGDARKPQTVVLEGKGLRKSARANGVLINGADHVLVQGLKVRNFSGNGFFAVNVDGYKLTNLIAEKDGVYGMYAFNSKGGEMSNSVAYFHNDAGFYIGQTPPQSKPKRSVVKNVRSYGNVLGFSGTNMRYVTIKDSEWFNNGVGIVPNALDSEKFQPDEDNVITGNDIFWNNFNYFQGAPFKLRKGASGELDYPVGTGVFLFGGRGNKVTGNRVFGNYLVGIGMLDQILLKVPANGILRNNQFTNNRFGLGNTDLNGRDLFYDGGGSGNCFEGNQGVQKTLPEDGSTFTPCSPAGTNAYNEGARNEAIGFALSDDHEKFWIKHPHAPRKGMKPLEHYTK